jgi:hypothetical protein
MFSFRLPPVPTYKPLLAVVTIRSQSDSGLKKTSWQTDVFLACEARPGWVKRSKRHNSVTAPEVQCLWRDKAKSKCGIRPLLKLDRQYRQTKRAPNNSPIPSWIQPCRPMRRTPKLALAVSTGFPN